MPRGSALASPLVMIALASAPLACSGDGGREDGDASASAGVSVGASVTVTVTAASVTITGASAASDGDSSGDSGPEKFDVGGDTDDLPGGSDCGHDLPKPGDKEFSVIWIANTAQHTVSKIDTVTAKELARYRTGPGATDPSRTSVNLRGDVAVANRSGSIVKIANQLSSCVDTNLNGTIDTSSGPNDIRAWGEDECVLWYHDVEFPQGLDSNQGGPRGIAWDSGQASDCFLTANVWVGWRDQPSPDVKIRRLNGNTGKVDAEVVAPNWQCNWGHGTYGGAADREGGFWGLGTLANLVHVDPLTLEVERFKGPEGVVLYGMALDAEGTPWLGGWDGHVWRFNPAAKTFEDLGATGPKRLRGLAIDKDGDAWFAGNSPCALVHYDTTTETLVNGNIALEGCSEPVGVSIDRYGQVWVVDREASRAYRVDPDTYEAVIVDGLVGPYTYSDMTGEGLGLVVNPPVG